MRLWHLLVAAPLLLHGLSPEAAAGGGVMPRAGWNGLHTANFYVIGDAGPRKLREVATRLEQFRDALGVLFPKAALGSSTPTTVLVFGTDKSCEAIKPLFQGKAPKDIVGFFQPGTTVNYITLTTQHGLRGLGVTYHEYVHLVVNNTVRNVPLWFNEGLAEYYSTFDVSGSGDRATLGMAIAPHVLLLRQQWVPLEELAAVDHASPLYNEANKLSVFYAESWALVHYLLVGNDHQLGTKASAFLGALINGMPFARACESVLGMPVNRLENELRSYVDGNSFRSRVVRFTDRITKTEAAALAPVSEAEVHATLADVLANMNRREDARAELAAALALDPAYGPAHALLGTLALFDHDLDTARPELEKAAGSPSATYLCHYYYAMALAGARRRGGTLSAEENDRIESELGKAIELNADFPDSHAQLAWQLGQSAATRPEAVTEMAKALDLSPGREEYALGLASLLANVEDFSRAKALLAPLASRAASQTVRQQAAELLASILDFEAGSQPVTSPEGLFRPVLRDVGPGETRVAAMLEAITCGPEGIVVVTTANGKVLRAGASSFAAVDFITYRHDKRGRIVCGVRHDDRVLLTYRTDGPLVPGTEGTAVAVEFVPDGYVP